MNKTHSGGGRTPVQVTVKTGADNRAKSPCAVAQFGGHVGNAQAVEKLDAGKALPSKLGNEVAKNVNGGGPGAGRTVHKSGAQNQHGPANPGSPRPEGEFFPGRPTVK
jgi:hypothetical protein